ncbi:LacI family DNA-binding transcriptional regulator [Microbacterium sp. TPD7012]|uniref:LacI family DNA-binding transcriptional regulator n=1 Tax=Microbacterium sp. TPD7012 TaxID=2171975 RepID=UPI000D52062B|nr:LacI family DNA-binding transcriptional regulator [Microbacterium sp. TPD7012]PVE98182.1 LacI family transcriptional regulator [Microbacterium sp. TPD7012]
MGDPQQPTDANPSKEFDEIPATLAERIARRGSGATIYDIAELANVNPSTVSRALSKPGRISEKTEARVRAAAERLDFRFNAAARALPTGRNHMLAVVVSDITNPMVFGILRGAEQAAAASGYALVIAESQESGLAEAEAIQRLIPSVDGFVLATTRLSDLRIRDIASRRPVVLINRAVDDVPGILPDVNKGVDQLMDHLLEGGHQTIAYLSGPASSWVSQRRWERVVQRAVEADVAAVEIGPNAPTIEGGADALSRVKAARSTAVIAFNDLIAIGLMRAAASDGMNVPQDLSVAGFDNIFGSELIVPALTTVRSDLEKAGERAVEQLLATLGVSEASVPLSELLDTSLLLRESTAALAPKEILR